VAVDVDVDVDVDVAVAVAVAVAVGNVAIVAVVPPTMISVVVLAAEEGPIIDNNTILVLKTRFGCFDGLLGPVFKVSHPTSSRHVKEENHEHPFHRGVLYKNDKYKKTAW
jgi:hypothetical protein